MIEQKCHVFEWQDLDPVKAIASETRFYKEE